MSHTSFPKSVVVLSDTNHRTGERVVVAVLECPDGVTARALADAYCDGLSVRRRQSNEINCAPVISLSYVQNLSKPYSES